MSELTKKAITAAFIQLLNEKPLDKITVKEIVERCGINRNTFYYHYHDIYELLEDIFESEADAVIANNDILESWQEGLIASADFALQNKKAIYHIYHSINREVLENYLNRITSYMINRFVRMKAEGLQVSEKDIRLVVIFYKHAIVGTLLEWIDKGMKEDPESAIRRLGELFEGNIRMCLERVSQ